MRLEALVLLLVLTGALAAQEAPPAPAAPAAAAPVSVPTPRQAYQKVEALFAQGHVFTADEEKGLDGLRSALNDSGDTDLAADLDLLRLGAANAATSAAAHRQAVANLAQDTEQLADKERFLRDRGFWRGVRDGSLYVFTAATVATLLLAVTGDKDQALTQNGGYYSDWADRQAFVNGTNWALLGSASTMFLSLFPLLWGEARQ
jgi:hypothetical protein